MKREKKYLNVIFKSDILVINKEELVSRKAFKIDAINFLKSLVFVSRINELLI